ncbi:DNA-binding protein [Maridesulfovibrio sp. FT414]|uniref:DNA-binding protein n=1 Tax=Maridesulfovibrio sp. FT414 TaxID=2979469 RepID=UPI003D807214
MSGMLTSPLILKGAKAICEAVQENPRHIGLLVESEGLPAWRRTEADPWRARPEALQEWVRGQEEKYLAVQKGVNQCPSI